MGHTFAATSVIDSLSLDELRRRLAAYRLETRRSSERIASEMNAAIVGDKDREPVRARTVHRFLFDPDITPSEFTIADVRDFLKHLEAKAAGAATEKPRRTRVS